MKKVFAYLILAACLLGFCASNAWSRDRGGGQNHGSGHRQGGFGQQRPGPMMGNPHASRMQMRAKNVYAGRGGSPDYLSVGPPVRCHRSSRIVNRTVYVNNGYAVPYAVGGGYYNGNCNNNGDDVFWGSFAGSALGNLVGKAIESAIDSQRYQSNYPGCGYQTPAQTQPNVIIVNPAPK